VIEPAVKMRRLPANRSLDALVQQGAAGSAEMVMIARRLAVFHAAAQSAPAGSEFGAPDTVREIVLDNLDRVQSHCREFVDAGVIADVRSYSEAFLELRAGLFDERRRSGRIKDCHGDLHAANIFLEPAAGTDARSAAAGAQPAGTRVQIIDCVEFSDRLRVIDPAADIAFLAMDLERLGRPDLAREFLTEYLAASGDSGASGLLTFYMVYRAMVRCLAAGLTAGGGARQDSASAASARAYGSLAASMASRERPLMLVIMAGTTGSGKSTLARLIGGRWGSLHLQSDVIRKQLAGLAPQARTGDAVRVGLYSPEMSHRTYREMERLGAAALVAGRSVVLDATFLRRKHRAQAVESARAALTQAGLNPASLAVAIVECTVPEKEQIERLETRYAAGNSESEGRPEVYRSHLAVWEGVRSSEADAVVRLNTALHLDLVDRAAMRGLWSAALGFVRRA
jgi:aminoglycoside phosphotransferase family enzyme/predicted kinase